MKNASYNDSATEENVTLSDPAALLLSITGMGLTLSGCPALAVLFLPVVIDGVSDREACQAVGKRGKELSEQVSTVLRNAKAVIGEEIEWLRGA